MMETLGECSECGGLLTEGRGVRFCLRCLLRLGLSNEANGDEGKIADPGRVVRTWMEDGQTFAGYQVEGEIARGAMGVVLRAQDLGLGRWVALKVMLGGHLSSVEARQRFRLEAEAAARLDHPNIVPILDVGESGGQPYFCMRLIDGLNLAQVLQAGPVPTTRAVTWVMKVARAVHHAHLRGVLHRDIKPANILIDAGDEPQLIDFGLARIGDDGRNLTLSRAILGTAAYMAPEMARGERNEVTVAADIFSLGSILYELLTGMPPFVGATPIETLHKVCTEEPAVPSRRRRPGGSDSWTHPANDLDTICLKCLEKSPGRRYASASDLADDLQRWLRGEPIVARHVGVYRSLVGFCRRRPVLASLAVVVPLLTVLGMAGILNQWLRAERHANAEIRLRRQAESALARLEVEKADRLLADDHFPGALRQMSHVVRRDPGNAAASALMASIVGLRCVPIPIARLLDEASPIHALQLNQDGRFMVTASESGDARVWDSRTGRPVSPALRHQNPVLHAEFSRDGNRMVTVDAGKEAWIWDVGTWARESGPLRHGELINLARFSPDGRWLVTTSDDHTARLWSVESGEPVSEPLRHGGQVVPVGFSTDSSVMYAGSFDGTVRCWSVPEGRPLGEPIRWAGPVRSLALSPDGTRMLMGGMRGVAELWSLTEGRRIGEPMRHADSVNWAEFSHDGLRVATASGRMARVWDGNSGRPVTESMIHDAPVTSVAFTAGDENLLTSAGGAVWGWRLYREPWDAESLEQASSVRQVEFSPDGRTFLVAADDRSVQWYETATHRWVKGPLFHEAGVRGAHFSPDGLRMVTVTRGNTVSLWDLTTGLRIRDLGGRGGPIWDARFDPGGSRLVTASEDGTVSVWSVDTGALEGVEFRHARRVNAVRFSPDGRYVATACADGQARVWDTLDGTMAGAAQVHGGEVRCVEFSPDGRGLLSAAADGSVQVGKVGSKVGVDWTVWHDGRVNHAAWSPDGRQVITASSDRTAQIRDAATGRVHAVSMVHAEPVVSAKFSPDGQRVITASWDGTARVWDVETCLPVSAPLHHRGGVFDACFAPDGGSVLTAGGDQSVRHWNLWLPAEGLPWLAEVGAALSGETWEGFDRGGGPARLLSLALETPWRQGTKAAAAWGDWFFQGRRVEAPERPVALPGLETLLRRIENDDLRSIAFTGFGQSTQGVLLARLARALAPAKMESGPGRFRQAEWLVERALNQAPAELEPWLARTDLLERQDRPLDALAALEQAIRIGPDSLDLGIRQARLNERIGRIDDSLLSLSRVLDLPGSEMPRDRMTRGLAYQARARVHARGHRWFEAGRDFAMARELFGIPERPATLPDRYLDLAPYFTQGLDTDVGRGTSLYGTFVALPRGVQRLAGVEFDVRGLVLLAGDRLVRRGRLASDAVRGIPVRQNCRRLHFLHATSDSAPDGTLVGKYVMHMKDGSRYEMPIRQRWDVMDYWRSLTAPGPTQGQIAWSGKNSSGAAIALYAGTWENPRTDLEVDSLDLVSERGPSSLMVVAVTAE